MNLDTTIRLELDCSERLEKVLTSIALSLNGITNVAKPSEPEQSKEILNDVPLEAVEMPKPKAKAKSVKAETKPEKVEPKPEEPKAETPVAPVAPVEVEVTAETRAEISDVEVRAAIKSCRERILNGHNDPILHAAVRDALKEKVKSYGAESSKDLKQEYRAEFIEFCNIYAPVDETEADQAF